MRTYALKPRQIILSYMIFFSLVSTFVYVYRSPYVDTKSFNSNPQPTVERGKDIYQTRSLLRIEQFNFDAEKVLLRSIERVQFLAKTENSVYSNMTKPNDFQTLYVDARLSLKTDITTIRSYSDSELYRYAKIKVALLNLLVSEDSLIYEYQQLVLDESNKSQDRYQSIYRKEINYLEKCEELRNLYKERFL